MVCGLTGPLSPPAPRHVPRGHKREQDPVTVPTSGERTAPVYQPALGPAPSELVPVSSSQSMLCYNSWCKPRIEIFGAQNSKYFHDVKIIIIIC